MACAMIPVDNWQQMQLARSHFVACAPLPGYFQALPAAEGSHEKQACCQRAAPAVGQGFGQMLQRSQFVVGAPLHAHTQLLVADESHNDTGHM